MSEPSVERILEDFVVFRNAYQTIYSIQENLERLRDEYVTKSYHKQQLKKLGKIHENQNKTLKEENEKCKKEIESVKSEYEDLRDECAFLREMNEITESSLKNARSAYDEIVESEIELRNERNTFKDELEELKRDNQSLKRDNQSLLDNYTKVQNKRDDMETRNSKLESRLASNKETIHNLKEQVKILEHENHGLEHAKKGLEHDKKGLELSLKQKKRQFESLSKESPEIANKICKQQGYAITSDGQGKPTMKLEPGEILDTKHSSKNFMCRDCYSGWLSKIPESGDLTMVPNPVDEIKTFSSQSDLEAHILVDHTTGREKILKCWQDGSTYTCAEPDSKNGTCSFKSNSKHQYRMHLKVDHANIHRASIYEIYDLKSCIFHLKSFRPNLNIIPQFTPISYSMFHAE